jgi:hypothetical protein
MGQTQNQKKKNFNPNWKLSACAESNKQFTTAQGCPSQDGIPTTQYSQKTFCKKRLKIGPKIGTNEQIQNSKKKPAVMAFWKKALGCGIPFLDINCKVCSVFTQNRNSHQSTAGLSFALPFTGLSIILYKNVGTKPFC